MTLTTLIKRAIILVLLAALFGQITVMQANEASAQVDVSSHLGGESPETVITSDESAQYCYLFPVDDGEDVDDATISLLEEWVWFSLAGDGKEAYYSPGCIDYPWFISELPDEARWDFYDQWKLPPAPDGYKWAEDITLVPASYWG